MKLGDAIFVYIGDNLNSNYDQKTYQTIITYFSKSKLVISNKIKDFNKEAIYKQSVIGIVLTKLNDESYKFIKNMNKFGIPVLCHHNHFQTFNDFKNVVKYKNINSLLSSTLFFKHCRINYKQVFDNTYKYNKPIKNFNEKILILEYDFKPDTVYSIKIKNFKSKSNNTCSYLYSTDLNTPIIKVRSSELCNDLHLNINYLDTRIPQIKKCSYIIIKNSDLVDFSFDELIIEHGISEKATSLKLLDVPDMQTYKKTNTTTRRYNVACILDNFSHACFSYELNLIPVTKKNWKQLIDETKIDFFLCESAWKGNDEEWIKELENFSSKSKTKELNKLMQYLNSKKISKVFYNKEDPISFDIFKEFSTQFVTNRDCIITTDENMVIKYKELGCKNVIAHPFCCQPVLHNPVNKVEDEDKSVIFPCTYYAKKYPHRCEEMRDIFDSFLDIDPNTLDIYDRQYVFNKQSHQIGSMFSYQNYYRFPDKYNKLIKGALTYEQVISMYKRYKVVMNVNTVTDSCSMFSRRVMEAAACSTPVISNKSVGIEMIFGDSVVDYKDKASVNRLLNNDKYRKIAGDKLYKNVMKNYTYKKLIDTFVKFLPGFESSNGLAKLDQELDPKIICLIILEDKSNLKRFVDVIKKYDCLILSENINTIDLSIGRVSKNIDISNRENLNIIKEIYLTNYKYLVVMNEDYTYCDDYIDNSLLPSLYTDAEIFGKSTDSELGHRFTNKLNLNTLIVDLDRVGPKLLDLEGNLLENLQTYLDNNFEGENMYSSDRYDCTYNF